MLYPLLLADHPNWHHHRDYSPQIRDILSAVFGILDRAKPKALGFQRAYRVLRPFLDAPMSPHQRLRMWYIAAQARAARDEHAAALYWINEALDLDSRLHDTADLPQLFVDRGTIHRHLERLSLAADDYRQALHVLDRRQRSEFHDLAFRLNTLSFLVGFEFYRAHPWAAHQYLDLVDGLIWQVAGNSLVRATWAWMHSLIDRWAGYPNRALDYALTASEIYTDQGLPESAARITLHAADCSLDMTAQMADAGTARLRRLRHAKSYLRQAQDLARKGEDAVALELVALTNVRYDRLAGRTSDRMVAVERALRRGRDLDDLALRAMALTTLGDELRLRDFPDAALGCYRRVVHFLSGSDIPAAGVWALRAAQALEQQPR